MSDDHGGLGFKLNRDTMSWAFRGILSVITAVGLYILSDFKESVKSQYVAATSKLDALTATQSSLTTTLNVLTQSVNDNIRQENDIIRDIRTEQNDHEMRIRTLERPPQSH